MARYQMCLTIERDPDRFNEVVGMVGVYETDGVSYTHVCVGPDLDRDQIRIGNMTVEEAWVVIQQHHKDRRRRVDSATLSF